MRNVISIVQRNFIRKPVTNLINLLGLSVSLAMVLILSVYCYSELTTDHHHEDGDRVFLYGQLDDHIYMPGILKDQIDLKIPDVETTVRIAGTWETPVFQVEKKEPISSDLLFADEDFFHLFTYDALEGDLQNALEKPMSIVLTKSLAKRLFGKEKAYGQSVKLNNNYFLTVTAVIEEPENKSCLSFNALTSIASRKIIQSYNAGEFSDWGWCNFQTFLLLKKASNTDETAKKIASLFPEDSQNDNAGNKLNPLNKIYFSKVKLFGSDYLQCGDQKKVVILFMVAVLVLMIALINFVHISTAQWQKKIRQTGVMKVIGASRSTILGGVLSESLLLFILALMLSFLFIRCFLPFIQNYTGISFNHQLLQTPGFYLLSIIGTSILSTLFSLIPAWRISSSNVGDNLKNRLNSSSVNRLYRSAFVTIQFTIAIVLIAFTVLVQKQVGFGSSDLGFNQKSVLAVRLTPQLNGKKEVFRKLLLENAVLRDISMTQFYPGSAMSSWTTQLQLDGTKKELSFDTFSADAVFFKLLGLQLKQGRLFRDDLISDAGKMVVNETFLRDNNLTEPIGKVVPGMNNKSHEIIGVVRDFHYKSFNQPISSLAIRNDNYASYCLIDLQTNDFKSLRQIVEVIKTTASNLSPAFPVEISFLDQAVQQMYESELLFRHSFTLLALFAIVICCLGIFALSMFESQRRIKEIGIRKVNGATISEMMFLLNKDFINWVTVAFLIATPIAYFAMYKWLEGFAYKTALSWWIFVLAGLLALAIALLTVGWQSYQTAKSNPVESLKND